MIYRLPARYGGDEFTIILPQTKAETGRVVWQRLVDAVKADKDLSGVSVSIGLASTGPEELVDGDNLVRLADQAMYVSKKTDGFAINIVV